MGGKVLNVSRYSKEAARASGRPEGSVMTVVFELGGQSFMGLNGGPVFSFTPAISMMVNCDTQKEIDLFWERLSSNGGKEVECGWVTDRFGLSWQIVPAKFGEWMKDPERAKRVMAKLMTMKRLDIATLEGA
jgi:predicted 3-demethylubiquinone-9 3-methyltransferase (glyoxalase superfamily)